MSRTRLQLFVSDEDAKLLKQSALEEDKTLSEHIATSAQTFNFSLTGDIDCKISYIGQVEPNSEFWRIDVEFIETKTGYWLREGWYEIWVSEEFIEDFLHLSKSPSKKDMAQFAYQFISKRYSENNNELPKEYGSFCSNKTGIKKVDHSGTLLSYFKDTVK